VPDHFDHVYRHRAEDYQRLVAREDHAGRLLPALAGERALDGLDVVETGAGTGRLTDLLARHVARVHAFDGSRAMLEVAAEHLRGAGADVLLGVADHRALPLAADCADLAVEGWAFGHFVARCPETWRAEVEGAVAELRRVLRPGGEAVLIETLGTGTTDPRPPHPGLAALYAFLEARLGFSRTWIRTDYRFASLAEADELTRFFFGDDLADRVVREEWVELPECTGVWRWRAPTGRP